MSLLRRFLGWMFFLGFLGAVGFGVFHFVRFRPRCTIAGPAGHRFLSADGSRLATLDWTKSSETRGPLRVWDTRRGHIVHELFANRTILQFETAPDRRHLAAAFDGGAVHLVDWQSGLDTRLPVARLQHFEFSPTGGWLFVRATSEPDEQVAPGLGRSVADRQLVYELATKQRALRVDESFFHSGNERFLFVRKWGEREIAAWDLVAGRKSADFPANEFELASAPDHSCVAVWRRDQSGIQVWDLDTSRLRFDRDLARTDASQTLFSPDARALAIWQRRDDAESTLELFDAHSGRLLWRFATAAAVDFRFSGDGALCSLVHGRLTKEVTHRKLTMFDAATGRVLWQREGGQRVNFAGDAQTLFHRDAGVLALEFLDAGTGACKAALLDVDPRGVVPEFTPDSRHVLLQGRQKRRREPHVWEIWLAKWWPNVFGDNLPCISIVEMSSGRERFRLLHHGFQHKMLSDDGSTLVTVDAAGDSDDKRIVTRVWDVHPDRAWWWAIGVAVGTGLGLLAAHWTWRRRQVRKRTAATA